MNCLFVPIPEKEGHHKCSVCGRVVYSNNSSDKIFAQCKTQISSEDEKRLTVEGSDKLGVSFSDVAHYSKALVKWGLSGFPVRTDEEVKAFHAICMECNHQTEGRCRLCGCRVTKSSLPITNKIKMATEKCPVGKWA